MTSRRKVEANRANARKSTGPKTPAGRARAATNARRHGLRVPVLADPILSDQVEAMALRLADGSDSHLLDLARQIAEAEVDVLRVRRTRAQQINLADCKSSDVIDRYERRAISRRKFAIRAFDRARRSAQP